VPEHPSPRSHVGQLLVTLFPLAVFVADELPEFVWVTDVVLEFDAVAFPVVMVAVAAPVFEACEVLLALPPVFPAWLPSLLLSMPPPETLVVPVWLPAFTPMTAAMAVLWPVFAAAPCQVSTDEPWLTDRKALPPLLRLAGASWADTVLSFAVLLDDAPPLLPWLTVVFAEFGALALPVLIEAALVPVFAAVASFVQSPPEFPAVLLSATLLRLPPSRFVVQSWLPRFRLPVMPTAWFAPVLA
jgi:hypothetical protein